MKNPGYAEKVGEVGEVQLAARDVPIGKGGDAIRSSAEVKQNAAQVLFGHSRGKKDDHL